MERGKEREKVRLKEGGGGGKVKLLALTRRR